MAEGLFQIHKYQSKYMLKLFPATFCWWELIAISVALPRVNIVIHTDFEVRMNEHLLFTIQGMSI